MKNAAIFALILLITTSCGYRVEKMAEPTVQLNTAALGFSEVQTAIFGPKCSRCHGWAASYEGVVANLAEISARTQSSDPAFMMPPPGRGSLSPEEKAALQSWIAKGAPRFADGGTPNPTPAPSPSPGPAPVPAPPGLNFANVQEKVFAPKCSRCHGFVGSYEGVVPLLTQIESRVRSPLEFEQMPPPRAAQLTPEEKNLLLDWIKAGAPKNGDGGAPNPSPAPGPAPQPPPNDCDDDDDHEEDDLIAHKKCDRNERI